MTTVNAPATITAKENNGPMGGSAYIYGGLHTSLNSSYSASTNSFNTSNSASVYNTATTDTKTIVGTGTGSDFRTILLNPYGSTTLSFKIDVWAEYSYSHSGPAGTSGTITAPENQIRISNVSLSTP